MIEKLLNTITLQNKNKKKVVKNKKRRAKDKLQKFEKSAW